MALGVPILKLFRVHCEKVKLLKTVYQNEITVDYAKDICCLSLSDMISFRVHVHACEYCETGTTCV